MPLTVRANLATQWQGFNGNVTAPMYSFSSAPGSGLFHAGSNGNVGMSVNGTEVAQVTTNSLVLNGSLVTPAPTMFKNLLINGDMRIMQRGPPAANIGGSEATAYTLDRWFVTGAGAGNSQVSQVLSGLSGFQYALRCQRPNGVTSINFIHIGQSLETVNTVPLQGKTVTLSYSVRGGDSLTGIVRAYVGSGTGVDQAPGPQIVSLSWTGQVQLVNTAITVTTSWSRFTHTFSVPSNAQELLVAFLKTNVGTAGTNDYFDVTGIQLEIGSVATTFEQRPFATELALCQRYYSKSYELQLVPGSSTGFGALFFLSANGSVGGGSIIYKQSMRARPGITLYGPLSGTQGMMNQYGNSTNFAALTDYIGVHGFFAYTSSLPAGASYAGVHYTADAEISTSIVTANQILYLDPSNSTSYPGTGSTWYDLMNLSNATQSASGVTFIPNEPRYFNYNGSTGYHDMTLTNTSGAWVHTISFWFQLNVAQASITGNSANPFFIGNAATLSQCSALIITATTHSWYFYSNDTTFTYSFAQNTWYHMCLTYSGGNANSTNKQLYINGTNVALTGSSTSPLNIAANAQMNIGRERTSVYFFPGKIGEFIVYNGALTAAQALQNFTARRSYYGV